MSRRTRSRHEMAASSSGSQRSVTITLPRLPSWPGRAGALRQALGRVGQGRPAFILACAVAGMSVVAVLVVRADQRRGDIDEARRQATASLRDRIPAMLSYDYRQLDADLDVSAGNATGSFGREFSALLEDTVYPNARKKKITTTARVTGAAVVDADPDKVEVLAFLTQSTSSSGSKTGKTSGSRLVVTMQKTDRGWFVAGMKAV